MPKLVEFHRSLFMYSKEFNKNTNSHTNTLLEFEWNNNVRINGKMRSSIKH